MKRVHHNILCTAKEYEEVHKILCAPIVVEGRKKGLMRRPERQEIILAAYVGTHYGHGGEFEGRRVIWFIEMTKHDEEVWERIQTALSALQLRYTDDGAETQKFLGRA